MNPAVYADPQIIPQTMPPRGRGRPTLYSQDLVDEFCGLIVDGNALGEAAIKLNIGRRTVKTWFKQYPEFRREFEESVIFRNECWLDAGAVSGQSWRGSGVCLGGGEASNLLSGLTRR
jgi:hypothetical protein